MRQVIRLAMCFALVAAMLGSVLARAAAQDGEEMLTIYKAMCPPGYTGTDYVEDCFDNPVPGVEFAIGTPNTGNIEFGTTGPDGTVSFALAPFNLGPNPENRVVTVGEILTSITAVESYAVFCTDEADEEAVDLEYETGEVAPGGETLAVRFSFDPGDQIRCNWYNVPPAVEEPPLPTAPTTPDEEPAPRPAAIRVGDCNDADLGEVVAELTDLNQPAGETIGQDDAVVAATSYTVVDLSLQQILEGEHVITIGGGAAGEADEIVACGEIGGVLRPNGSLAIGLAEQDGSDVTGIAYLSPAGGGQTAISVFVAEGLAGGTDEPVQEA